MSPSGTHPFRAKFGMVRYCDGQIDRAEAVGMTQLDGHANGRTIPLTEAASELGSAVAHAPVQPPREPSDRMQ